jgi:zinc/manganese transport system ATP-binding protein
MACRLVGGGRVTPVIKLHDLTVAYDRRPAVHHIKGEFAEGELTAITGPNGAGKSTLLKAIAGILPVFEGSIEFRGLQRNRMAYLPQAADLQADFPISILQMVSSGLWQKSNGFQKITAIQKHQCRNALRMAGLEGLESRTLDSLSAGQFQRALFARVIVQDARLILLDEPFTSIDAATTESLLRVIKHWHEEKRTVICVLHDFEQIRTHFDNCLLIARECIAWGKSREVLRPENLFNARFFREAAKTRH